MKTIIKKILLNFLKLTAFLVVASIIGISISYAGSLTPPGSPSATMNTLDDIYTKLTTNTNAGTHSLSTTTAPTSTFHTLTQIYGAIPTIDATKILTGTSYLGISGSITVKTGEVTASTSATSTNKLLLTVPIGYYDGTVTLSTTSTNFTATNIKSGTTVFGLTGSLAAGSAAAPLATGLTVCYNASGGVISCTGTGQDAELLKGVAHLYTDNGEATSTITDNSTGLVWQKCSKGLSGTDCATGSAVNSNWTNALAYCNANTAQLPGSGWRLPNVNELLTLVDYSTSTVATINGVYFPNTTLGNYWTSSTVVFGANIAWYVNFLYGYTGIDGAKSLSSGFRARCVRG